METHELDTNPLNFNTRGREGAYDVWLATQDVPVHTGHYVEDFRVLDRGWWSLRGCPAAVLKLTGHAGVEEAHVLEIPPGKTIPPFRMAVEEVIYVAEGQGLATVWADGHPKVTFEWHKHSLFRIPANYYYQLSNARGDQTALTLHTSYLPMAMHTNSNPEFFFNNPFVDTRDLYEGGGNFYSSPARAVRQQVTRNGETVVTEGWYANFFPDLTIWENLRADTSPGRLSFKGDVQLPDSSIRLQLMVLPARRYRTAHRHGPGVTIIGIQEAEGFCIMWPEGGDYTFATWKEGSVFVPPDQWYHMHVNTGSVENRQLRIFPPQPLMGYSAPRSSKGRIPLVDEDPWIRQRFDEELAKNGLTSLMPPEAYTDPNFEWDEEWLAGE
jgi:hypothetical protein